MRASRRSNRPCGARKLPRRHGPRDRCRERLALVGRAVDLFVENKATIAEAITRQMGRPLRYTAGEVDGFASRARHMMAIAEDALKLVQVDAAAGFTRFISREPVGVVLTIAPWNYPLLTAVNSIVPALLAGNAVILKHSDQTPLCAELIHQAFVQAEVPEGVFQYLHVDHERVRRLIHANEIGFVCFTGSVGGGRIVEEAAAGRFIGVGLELGGNDPAYVRTDANLDYAVGDAGRRRLLQFGPVMLRIQRIYVASASVQGFCRACGGADESVCLGQSA